MHCSKLRIVIQLQCRDLETDLFRVSEAVSLYPFCSFSAVSLSMFRFFEPSFFFIAAPRQ